MSYQTWRYLGKPMLDPTPKFVRISRTTTGEFIGAINVVISINFHSENASFFVMSPGQLHEEVVLGRYCMVQCQCYRGLTKLLLSTPNDKELSISVPLVLDHPTTTTQGVQKAQVAQKCTSKETTRMNGYKGKIRAE